VDALEAIGSARSMRWLRPDPVPDEHVQKLLWAATRASSAHNCQPWRFVVVREPTRRRALGRVIRDAADVKDPLPPNPETRTDQLIDAGVRNLLTNVADAPVIIMICGVNIYPSAAPVEHFMWSALHAAGQNLVVAARALGLGAAITMLHRLAESEVRAVLELPDGFTSAPPCRSDGLRGGSAREIDVHSTTSSTTIGGEYGHDGW
jgi:nitroreductase